MGVAQRLEIIEFRLFGEWHVNRSDFMEAFGISVNHASTDLNRYVGYAPENMIYDKRAITYDHGPEYTPQVMRSDASRYIAQLRSFANGIIDCDDIWIDALPSHDAAPTPVRGANPVTLRSVIGAIRCNEALEVNHQSLSRPLPRWRRIASHAVRPDTDPSARKPRDQQIILLNREAVRGDRQTGHVLQELP